VSGKAMEWAYHAARVKHLDPTARFVLVALASYANAYTGRAWPSAYDELVEGSGLSPRTVSRALARIEATGLITVHRRKGRTTVWTFPPEARRTPQREGFTHNSFKTSFVRHSDGTKCTQ
jgi:DNA-binding transcriptional ArsR family regulator